MATGESNTHGQGPNDPHPGTQSPPTDAPIVVTSERLNDMRNPSAPAPTPAPRATPSTAARRALSSGRVRIAYDGTMPVVIVGTDHTERTLPSATRFQLTHAEGRLPTLAIWLVEHDATGSYPTAEPIDVPDADIVDVPLMVRKLREQASQLAMGQSVARAAAADAARLALVSMGVQFSGPMGGSYARTDMPPGVDPAAIVDNALLKAYALRELARPTLGDALTNAQLVAADIAELLGTYAEPNTEELLTLSEAMTALSDLTNAATWLAMEAQRDDAVAPERVAAIGAAVEQHDAAEGARGFAEWLVGPSGPPVMRAKTASQAESMANELVEAYVEYTANGPAGGEDV